ncbi:MAG: hemerythrin domain-containing protein [Betaproteobacteria bacterium]
MSDSIAYWRAEHANFAHLLDLLEKNLAAFHTDSPPDYEAMLDIIEYLRHFPDRYHHAREDVAFARLEKRKPQLAPILARLREEHQSIGKSGEALRTMLTAAAEDAIVSRQDIENAARDYLAAYRNHIATEELNVMPHAGSLLTDEDWAEVARATPSVPDPLFGAHADESYRELRRRIASNQPAA